MVWTSPVVYLVPFELCFVGSDHRHEFVGEQEIIRSLGAKDDGAATGLIEAIVFFRVNSVVRYRVRPKDVA